MSQAEPGNNAAAVKAQPQKRFACFVTGTDIGVGKSVVAASLLCAAKARGKSTAAMKPVASGCEEVSGYLRDEDALLMQRYCTVTLTYEQINPFALRAAVAPHLAANLEGKRLSVQKLAGFAQAVFMERADVTVIEGAGGWRVPLNQSEYLDDLPKGLQLPVVLVVGIRLGCLNHALLTAEAIKADGLRLIGWVANHMSADMPMAVENVATLVDLMPAPCLGELPWDPFLSPAEFSQFLDTEKLLGF